MIEFLQSNPVLLGCGLLCGMPLTAFLLGIWVHRVVSSKGWPSLKWSKERI